MTIQTCYLFTDAEQDKSALDELLAPYKDIYSAFILDSSELDACLIPRLDGVLVERAPADRVDITAMLTNPPDMFIAETPLDIGDGVDIPPLTKAQRTHNYTERLQETADAYAKKKGNITSVVFLTSDAPINNQNQ